MSLFRCVIPRTLGRDGLRAEGGGDFNVLYESYTFRNSIRSRRMGTKSAMTKDLEFVLPRVRRRQIEYKIQCHQQQLVVVHSMRLTPQLCTRCVAASTVIVKGRQKLSGIYRKLIM